MCDKGFNGAAFAAEQAARGTAVLLPPTRGERCSMPWMLPKVIAGWRNPVEASFGEITDRMKLAQRGAWLTRIDQLRYAPKVRIYLRCMVSRARARTRGSCWPL